MKKLIVTAMMVGLSLGAFAQGTVIFQNSASQLVLQDLGTSTVSAPAGTHVALYYSPTAVTDPFAAALHQISGGVGTLVSPGRFILGTKTTDTDAAAGSTIFVSIRGWTGNFATWNEAAAAAASGTQVWLGASGVFSMATGGVGTPPSPPIAISTIPGFTGFTITVPEPTTFALAGLGAAALLIFRRRS